jgi:hypothetical protein
MLERLGYARSGANEKLGECAALPVLAHLAYNFSSSFMRPRRTPDTPTRKEKGKEETLEKFMGERRGRARWVAD